VFELHEVSMLSFAVAIGIVMLIAAMRRKVLLGVVAVGVMGTSAVIAEIAKRLLVRPELVDAPPGWLNNSFPSGHASIAVAIGVGAMLVLPYSLRWPGAVVGALFAMSVGRAVETAGWHRL
jgi:membrane-associated phospholipid phosphatase